MGNIKIRDPDTFSITAFGFLDGEGVTEEMILMVEGDEVVMQQGNSRAEGKKEAKVYLGKRAAGKYEYVIPRSEKRIGNCNIH